jgi:hypothetical protein
MELALEFLQVDLVLLEGWEQLVGVFNDGRRCGMCDGGGVGDGGNIGEGR